VVLTSGDKHKRDVCTIDFDPKDRYGVGIGEINHKILYLCPKYVGDDTPEKYKEWLKAIDDSLDGKVEVKNYKKGVIKKIFDLIKKDKTTPQEYAKMKDEYSNELAKQKKFEEGMKEGMEKGKKEREIEIAKSLLLAKVDMKTIVKSTGLSIEEIKRLK
jgi:predicted transposase/invertase (TIGR01784 family)